MSRGGKRLRTEFTQKLDAIALKVLAEYDEYMSNGSNSTAVAEHIAKEYGKSVSWVSQMRKRAERILAKKG